MMKSCSRTLWSFSAALGLLFGAAASSSAVSLADLGGGGGNKSERANKSTTITSDTMDIDFQNNITVFTGNVFVDDPQLTIKCDKMTIYLRDKEAPKDAPKDAAKDTAKNDAKKSDKDSKAKDKDGKGKEFGNSFNSITPGGSGKELDKVVCTGKVVIVRKVIDKEEAKQGEQKAEAGKAVYDFREGTICLTEDNPRVSRGMQGTLAGSRITLWLDSERVKVESNDKPATLEIKNVGDLNKDTPQK